MSIGENCNAKGVQIKDFVYILQGKDGKTIYKRYVRMYKSLIRFLELSGVHCYEN